VRPQTVLISGASIAGPALAYWLNRYGFDVTVVEKAPTLRPGGQAVDFKGRTHRTVLERMGIWTEIQQRQTGKFDTVYLDAAGREQAVMSGEFTGGDIEILRGELTALLYERTVAGCEYRFGDSITAMTWSAPTVSTPGSGGWSSARSATTSTIWATTTASRALPGGATTRPGANG
jgi:2-polyprenyl-6-methoxyphenol hydroxylase-like FAD-dependent oxidoreductase